MMMETAATILIIDDKESNVHALVGLLEKPGREFLTANSGNLGLKLALNHNVDLIILDVQMPEMNGFEVAQILKSNKRTKDIPIIFASAEKKERDFVIRGFEEGAIDYLSKPLDPELTKAKVAVLLQLQQQRKELVEKNLSLQRAEAEIKMHLSQVEALNQELESFSYSVSHDLRAPLRAIAGFAQMLTEDFSSALGTEGGALVDNIRRNASRMDQLINDILEFSKSGRKQVSKREVDVQRMVEKVLATFDGSKPTKTKVAIDTLPSAFADPSLLEQVWMNLISNAFKYSSKKDEPLITISGERREDELVYIVKDNGAGFDMKYANRLFNMFQRLHKATEFEGTGIGLALIHKIITRHGGRVWAEAEKGKGATFYFSLPAGG